MYICTYYKWYVYVYMYVICIDFISINDLHLTQIWRVWPVRSRSIIDYFTFQDNFSHGRWTILFLSLHRFAREPYRFDGGITKRDHLSAIIAMELSFVWTSILLYGNFRAGHSCWIRSSLRAKAVRNSKRLISMYHVTSFYRVKPEIALSALVRFVNLPVSYSFCGTAKFNRGYLQIWMTSKRIYIMWESL